MQNLPASCIGWLNDNMMLQFLYTVPDVPVRLYRFDRFYFSKNPAPFAGVCFMRESLQRMSCPWRLMSPKKIYWCWFSVQVPEHVNNKTPISFHSEHSNICHISINLEQFHKSQPGCLHRMLLSLFPSLESECCVASILDLISILTSADVPEEILEQVRYWEACFMRWHDDDGHIITRHPNNPFIDSHPLLPHEFQTLPCWYPQGCSENGSPYMALFYRP